MTRNGLNASPRDVNCQSLSEQAEEIRLRMLSQNIYSSSTGNRYGATHPNATTASGGNDDPLNKKGKGTGEFFDTRNGGGYCDINGNVQNGGLGRTKSLLLNRYDNNRKYNANICINE